MLFSVLDRIDALDDRQRNGMVIGEGGAVLVAGAGTRKPYGWLSGFGIARDTTATISDWGDDPNAVITAMRRAIADAEIADVDAIYASANGSRRGDAVEQRAIEALLPDRTVITTKQIFGEYAAAGMLQLVAALLAVDEGRFRNVLVNSVSAGGGIVCAVVSA
jgi:3-oxoacyl-(acyl-carrier-protein) synthase